jgi:hypothetical protein
MSEPSFSIASEDDLPRTLRRERAAREREARERETSQDERLASLTPLAHHEMVVMAAPAATVTGFEVPFLRLMAFFVKAVFAAIPALVLLTLLLWALGRALEAVFPQLLAMKIMIYVPR